MNFEFAICSSLLKTRSSSIQTRSLAVAHNLETRQMTNNVAFKICTSWSPAELLQPTLIEGGRVLAVILEKFRVNSNAQQGLRIAASSH